MAAVVVLADHTDGRVHASAAELLTLAAGLGEAVAVLVALPAEHHDTAVAELGR
ncbi:MAG: electron transfer flavoprotein subunit alpha/FixB family protein, partial [Cellulomonadaceae bacterium]|nr:electron transfer flavoprotein subunit alpha/FixB family protein [Cellulomonadaceae bacterium]